MTTIPLSQEGYYSNGRNFDNDTSLPGGIQISNSLNKTEILLFRRSHNTRIPSNLVGLQSNSPPLDHKLVVFIYTNSCPKGRALVGVDKYYLFNYAVTRAKNRKLVLWTRFLFFCTSHPLHEVGSYI